MFGQPIEYHIISDVRDAENYVEIDKELRCIHRDYTYLQHKSAKWRLTREFIVNGLKADAIKIMHSKTECYDFLDISYFKPCLKL
jgi:hypothetical protein